ncbi:hypothetical protein BH11BAC7_BH11BAC7_28900 [soil metagenome]
MQVSVIIPLYNAGRFIASCLDSLLVQEPLPVEIICVDDASSDNGSAIVSDYEKKHPSLIKLIRLGENSGAPFARNTGLKIATGEYIQFLDADDYLLPGKISHQLQLIHAAETKPDFIAAAYTRLSVANVEREINVAEGNPWLALLNGRLGCTCSNLWKRDAVTAIAGFNESLKSSQEYGLMFDLLKNKANVIFDKVPFTMVRDQPPGQSVSRKDPPKNWEQYIRLRGDTILYLQNHALIKPEEKALFYQPLFEAIRILYNFSPSKSVELYKSYIPATFVPSVSPAITSMYCRTYKMFGFSFSEKTKTVFRFFKGRIKE